MRVYELAKKIGIDSKELIEILKEFNLPVKTHLSSIDEETAQIIEHEIEERKKKEEAEKEKRFLESLKKVELDFPLTVKDFSSKIQTKVSLVLKKLWEKNKPLNINQNIDLSLAREIGKEFGFLVEKKKREEEIFLETVSEEKDLKKRHAVITLMGHIDHGKTSILDKIRASRLTEKEFGGITQHIGAYEVTCPQGKITFLDTPGHETFTSMRSRGAQVTDIVLLVVAADEGVMPQTEEAISHAREAHVPIIVAINKIDKPQVDIDRVKRELSKLGLTPEDWGGDTICVSVSAKTGEGLNELLEMILLQSEMMELKANYNRPALGFVIESKLSRQKGPLATFLIKEGTLKKGDYVVAGKCGGKIRAMWDDAKREVFEATPSMPVEILGLDGLPQAGDKFFVVPDEEALRRIIQRRKEEEMPSRPVPLGLENLFAKVKEGKLKELKLILKADTYGTQEAVEKALINLSKDEVKINIIHKGVGAINTSDIILAEASGAVVIGFNVSLDTQAKSLESKKKVEVRTYQVIYELLNEVKASLEGLLEPKLKRVFLGRARVKKVFKLSKAGRVAGCLVEEGVIRRGLPAELIRSNSIIFKGTIQGLKRFKNDVREVSQGYECGISLGTDDIQEEDIIDVYVEEIEKSKP